MKVLVVGKGGREHAIVKKIYIDGDVDEIYVAPGNIGMKNIAKIVPIKESDIYGLLEFAKNEGIDLTIVGSELPISLGIVNIFEKNDLKIFAPTRESGELETSKEYGKKIMDKYGIPTAKYESFIDLKLAKEYLKKCSFPIVIKEDGLRNGKGVKIIENLEEGLQYLDIIFKVENKVVIEEYLEGFEFSMIAMIGGGKIYPLELAQDHKRIYDDDRGENTGGMGAYSPIPILEESIIEEGIGKIFLPLVEGMKKEGREFKGFLFVGVMLTKDGLKVIEFNVRLGDPETQVILPRLKSKLVESILKILKGEDIKLEWDKRTALCIVLAGKKYPFSSSYGDIIDIKSDIDGELYHMGTDMVDGKLVTNGGRILSLIVFDDNLEKAIKKGYQEIEKIESENLFYRKDIGKKGVIKK